MRTKEFIKRVEELGFDTWITGGTIYIFKDEEKTIARVGDVARFTIDSFYLHNKALNEEVMEKLFDLLIEYAKTPIEDREEEKKFYLKHRWLDRENEANYLNFEIGEFYYSLDSKPEVNWVKTKFTLKEIEEIKEKFDTDLADFELVEVEE